MKLNSTLYQFLIIVLIIGLNPVHAQKIIYSGLDNDAEISHQKTVSKKIATEIKSKDFECGDLFTDPRDGQQYSTVQIGEQCWMAENLNFGNQINASEDMTNNGIAEKYCYDNDPANCETYGALYQWNELMQYTVTEGIQGLCPDGWHIPSDLEWCTLEQTVDNSISCAAIFWRGIDGGTKLKAGGSSDFEGLLGGYIFSTGTSMQMGDFGYFWNSTMYNEYWSFFRSLGNDFPGVRRHYTSIDHSKSVRCLKGEGALNLPPTQPTNPTPENGSVDQSIGINLMWECSDPENDALSYDVYFGTESAPPLVTSSLSGNIYSSVTLDYHTVYYWKIVAHDTQGNETEGPVWNFRTIKQGGTFSCGDVITDPRDGRVYATTLIGDQCWMADNLNIGQWIENDVTMTDNGIIEKYCYDDDTLNCDEYGGMYQWDEMMQYSTQQGVSGICMEGWRLPTDNEWKSLEGNVDSEIPVGDPIWDGWGFRGNDVGGNAKEAGTSHWLAPNVGATNSSGFSAIGGGYSSSSLFYDKDKFGMYWSSTQLDEDAAIMRGFYYALPTDYRQDYSKMLGISVRCIQGDEAVNEPPNTPSNPSPANGATGLDLNSDLFWDCTDPDGDPLTYDVYFGTETNPPLIAEGISEDTFDPGMLEYYTNYFWKIVAFDDHGNSKEGPVWEFTTTQLFFTVTFSVFDENENPIENATITVDGVTNVPGDYIFDQVPEGTFNYVIELENYFTTYGNVTVVDENVEVSETLYDLVIVNDFPFTEGFDTGMLPYGWRNFNIAGEYNWEFATQPFPHAFIHNIGRPAVFARLVTPYLDATDLGQVTMGINHRFLTEPTGGAISIVVSEDGLNWQTIAEFSATISTGDDFEYMEFNLNEVAAGKQVMIALEADFPDTDASYEALWEVESFTVFEPLYSVNFDLLDELGNPVPDAVITFDGVENPQGDYLFESITAGMYAYVINADGFIDNYGFVTLDSTSITENVILREHITITEFPYDQDFADDTIPPGWNIITLGDPEGYWRFSQEQAQIMSNYGERTYSILVSPAFDCSQLESVALGLNHYYMDIYGIGFAEIVISTDGETWTTAEHFQGESVGSSNFPYFEYYLTEFAAGHEQVYVGLLYDDLAELEFWWLVDNFRFFEPVPYAIKVENLSWHNYVNDGDSFTYEFEIVNMGGEDDTYDLEVQDGTWTSTLSQQNIFLAAGERDTVYVTIDVPENLNMGEKNTHVLLVTSQGSPDVFDEADFTTVAVSTIKDNYFEDFDLVVAPELPGGWNKFEQSSAYWSKVQTVKSLSIAPVSAPNNVEIAAGDDLNPNLILISPEIDESLSLSDFRVVFWLRNPPSALLKIGTMSSPTGQFTELATYSAPNHFTWELKMFSYENYQGSDKYMAFKLDNDQENTSLNLDDISIEIIPPPILGVNPESWDFGEYWVQYPSEVPLNIDVKNIGHDYLTIYNIYLDNPDDFLLDYDHTLLNTQVTWNDNIPLTVHFNAYDVGPRSGNIVIEYNDGIDKTKYIPLEGFGLERPVGSTCDDPIYLELPVVDYENTTEFAGNDYNNFMVWPWAGRLGAYDMDFRFTLEEESYLSGSISGPYFGPSLYIMDRCPDENNPAPLYLWIESVYGGDFEDVVLPAGEYHMVISSPAAANPWTYYTTFVLNLSAEPTPDKHSVTFNLYEDSPEQSPVADAEVSITGYQIDLSLATNIFGQVQQTLYEYEHHVYIYKKDYEVHDFVFTPTSDTVLNIPMNDLIWTPYNLSVETDGLLPGQAFFDWIPKLQGEPWDESFENEYPPVGWDTIVTNHGQVQEPGYDWKFTWQKYGPVYFSDMTAFPVDGDYQAFVHWSTDPQDEWLITHEFEAPAGDLEFWYHGKNGSSFSDYFVKISTDGGETWNEIWNASDLPNGRNNYDYPAIIDLQPWAGQNIRIAWNAYGTYGLEGAWCIDKISVGEMRINVEDLMYLSKTNHHDGEIPRGTIPSLRDGAELPRVTFEDMNYNLDGFRSNEGFSVYLDDMDNPVATGVEESEFMFIGLEAGDYVAGVQAVYSTGQSEIVTIPFNNPVMAENYTVSFQVENANGQLLTGVQIKVLYAGEILKSLQTFNGIVNTTLPPGNYDFTAFKDGYKTFYGMFSVTNAQANVDIILETGYQLEFIVKNENDQPIENATVFCNGTIQSTSGEGITVFELDPGIYPYSVTHFAYNRVLASVDLQTSITETVIMGNLTCEPPKSLTAQIDGNNYGVLNWNAPTIGDNGTWIHWDRDYGNNAVGTGGTVDFDVAQRFATEDLTQHDGKFLTRIWFVPYEPSCSYSVRVWTGGNANDPGNLLVDQPVIDPAIGEWNEIFLITPVPVDATKELWFGLRNNTFGGYPASVDRGPATDGKGNMIHLPGNNWQTLLQVNSNLDYNWSVRGFVEPIDAKYTQLPVIEDKNRGAFIGKLGVTNNPPDRSLYEPRLLLGYNIYRNDEKINFNIVDTVTYTDVNLPQGTSTYEVTSVWSNGCESNFSNPASLSNNCQQYIFASGWNSLSSYVVSENTALETLFAPIQASLTFVQDMNGFYWPQQGINTIGDFDNMSGYAVKLSQETNFEICGDNLAGNEITLQAGWHYLPVLSYCDVDAAQLFESISNAVVIAQDLIGSEVYWSELGIYTLTTLVPGKAYKIKTNAPVTIQFPDCNIKSTFQTLQQENLIVTPFGDIEFSPYTQVVGFTAEINKSFNEEPLVAFDDDGRIFGFVAPKDSEQSFTMTLQGDDPATPVKDGFFEGDEIHFALYHAETGNLQYVETTFDPDYGKTDGKFYANSLAVVKSVTGINEPGAGEKFEYFVLYPNPADEQIHLNFASNEMDKYQVEIFNSEGVQLISKDFNGNSTIDVRHLSNGMYFVKITGNTIIETKKLIIR